jgi:hypothetical protein
MSHTSYHQCQCGYENVGNSIFDSEIHCRQVCSDPDAVLDGLIYFLVRILGIRE